MSTHRSAVGHSTTNVVPCSAVRLLVISLLILACCGCATRDLWRSQETTTHRKVAASCDQIAVADSGQERPDQPALALRYRASEPSDNFPPDRKGVAVIRKSEQATALGKGLQLILQPPFAANVIAHSASLQFTQIDGTHYPCLRIVYYVKRPFRPEAYPVLNKSPWLRSSFTTRAATAYDAHHPQGVGILRVFVPVEKCSAQTAPISLGFVDDLSALPEDAAWQTLAGSTDPLGINLYFQTEAEKAVYANSAAKRVLLTPFAILADLVVSPILVIGMLAGKWPPA